MGRPCNTALTSLVMSSSPDVSSLQITAIAPIQRANSLGTAPNLLTLFRICLAPILILALFERRFLLAFVLFVIAAGTDAVDGLLARWLRQRTRIGQYLDPIADKLLLSSLFLLLTYMGALQPYVAAIVFSRDLGMLLVAAILYAITKLRDFHPTLLGKANSFSQVVAIGLVLLSLIPDPRWDRSWVAAASTMAINATMLLTVLSGFHYAWVVSKRIGIAAEEETISAHLPTPLLTISQDNN